VINGQKVFTSGGANSDYIWLAARTDRDAVRHKGLSIIIVPTAAPGFRATPLPNLAEGGVRETTTTYYDDVVVPVSNLVGSENEGWQLITSQLNQERVALAASRGWILQLASDVRDWAAVTDDDGRPLIEREWVRVILARVTARLDAMKLFNWRVAANLASGADLPAADASVAKVYGTEVLVEACRLLLDVVGRAGYLAAGSPGAVLDGRLERGYRSAVVGTFAGGNNDMLREMIATKGLGLTRAPR
jgi:alkylation response protein AidB-like acyl-CoA dehydrogenase